MSISKQAAAKCTNVCFANTATDGVSVEVQKNFEQVIDYLKGKSNHIALTDPNHNGKNVRYQLIGGSGVAGASIGHYVFDPYLSYSS